MAEAEVLMEETEERDPNLLYDEETSGYRLFIRLENNQMECCADIILFQDERKPDSDPDPVQDELDAIAEGTASENADIESPEPQAENDELSVPETDVTNSEPLLSPAELIEILNRHNINQTIDFEALYEFCAAVEAGIDLQPVLVAKGIEPVTGADGWFELQVKTSGEEAEFTEDERGNVDLRTRNAFTEIEEGQRIGILHAPQEGTPGMTAHGLPIPAERGKIYSLVAGEGVELKYDGRVAYAEKEGRALLERQVLSVVDHWVISGDVDLTVGNIDFHGFVEVKGDVLDEFHIKATKGIKVGGVVGACRLESDGPIEIGSMAGKEHGEIHCKGDLYAGFLNQVTVNCYANVWVKNEIRNSFVKSTGNIIVEKGSIVGGSCVALEGIEARILGATSGLETRLTAGVYFPDDDRFNFLREQIKSLDAQIKRLKEAIGPLENLAEVDETTTRRLTILTEQWEKLEVEKEGICAEYAASNKQEQITANPKINAAKELLEGVVISLGNSTNKNKIERKGPLSIIENTKKGGFRYLSMTPLNKAAAEIEGEILEQRGEVDEEGDGAVVDGSGETGEDPLEGDSE